MKRIIFTILLLTKIILGAGDIYYDVNHHSNDVTGIGQLTATTGTFEYLVADVTVSGGVSVAYVDTQDNQIRGMVSNNFLLKSGGTMTGTIRMENNPLYIGKYLSYIDDVVSGYGLKFSDGISVLAELYTNTLVFTDLGGGIGARIANVRDPIDAQDVATKGYVDGIITGAGKLDAVNGKGTNLQITNSVKVVPYGSSDDYIDIQDDKIKFYHQLSPIAALKTIFDTSNTSCDLIFDNNIRVAEPALTNDAATKQYVDAATGECAVLYFKKTGGTIHGNVTLNGSLSMSGGTINNPTFSGVPILDADLNCGNNTLENVGNPTVSSDAANKGYVDAVGDTKLSKSGGTMTGSIDMNGHRLSRASLDDVSLDNYLNCDNHKIEELASPTYSTDAANKGYVDAATNECANLYVKKTDDTIENNLIVSNSVKIVGDTIGSDYINVQDDKILFYHALRAATLEPYYDGTETDLIFDNNIKTAEPISTNDVTTKQYVDAATNDIVNSFITLGTDELIALTNALKQLGVF